MKNSTLVIIISCFTFSCTQKLVKDLFETNFEKGEILQLYLSDHSDPNDHKNMINDTFVAIYTLPPKLLAKDKKNKGKLIGDIGRKRNPVWNYQGDHVAFAQVHIPNQQTNYVSIINVKDKTTTKFNTVDPSGNGLSWNLNGDLLAIALRNKKIALLDLNSKKVLKEFSLKTNPENINLSPDGKAIIYMTRDGKSTNDQDGWRLNLIKVDAGEAFPLGEVDDDFTENRQTFWHFDSSGFALKRGFINKNNTNLQGKVAVTYSDWFFDINTMNFEKINSPIKGYIDQKIRYWKSN